MTLRGAAGCGGRRYTAENNAGKVDEKEVIVDEQVGAALPRHATPCHVMPMHHSQRCAHPCIACMVDIMHASIVQPCSFHSAPKRCGADPWVTAWQDELWREMRHHFIADVYTALASRFKDFQSKNKAAKLTGGWVGGRAGGCMLLGVAWM